MSISLIVLILSAMALLAAPAAADLPQPGAALTDFDELARLADLAQAGTDPRVTANAIEEPRIGGDGRPDIHSNKLTLVSIDGYPAFVHYRRNFGQHDWQQAFTARCAGSGAIEFTALVFAGGYSWNQLGTEVGTNPALSIELAHANSRTPVIVPVTLERAFEEESRVQFFGRFRGTVQANDRFFDTMSGAPFLWARLMAGQQRLSPIGGSDLSNFAETMRALVTQCRGIGPATPVDRAIEAFNELTQGPSADSIRDALQRQIASGGALASATGLRVVGVERFECHPVAEGAFLCRYKPAVMGDTSNPVIRFALQASAIAAPSWGHFAPGDRGWTLLNVYDSCSPNDSGGFRCSSIK